jgi:hypothetical protein
MKQFKNILSNQAEKTPHVQYEFRSLKKERLCGL